MAQRRDLDVDFIALAGVVPDKGKAGIAAAKFARCGVEYAVACAMNGMKFNLVEAFPQCGSPAVVDLVNCSLWPGREANNPAHCEIAQPSTPHFNDGIMRGQGSARVARRLSASG